MMMSKTIQYLCEFINTQKNLQISLKYKAIESVLEGTSLELGARFYVQNVYECWLSHFLRIEQNRFSLT